MTCASRRRRVAQATAIALALGVTQVGCRGCADAPVADAGAPAGARVPVVASGGAEVGVIDAALLDRTPADFVDHERRAWKLATLLAAVGRQETTVELEDASGTRVRMPLADPDGRVAVLALNRAGELGGGLVKPDEPFPAFHGRGGNRRRAPDPSRVREVKKVWLGEAP